MREQILLNPQTFMFLIHTVQREDAHRKSHNQSKVKIEDGREAPQKPSLFIVLVSGYLFDCI